MTWCLSSSIFTDMASFLATRSCNKVENKLKVKQFCSMDSSEPSDPVLLPAACLRRSVSAASDQQQQQYFHVITNNKEESAADWTAPQRDSTTEALIGYHWDVFKFTVALVLLVRDTAGGWSLSVISPPPSVDIQQFVHALLFMSVTLT